MKNREMVGKFLAGVALGMALWTIALCVTVCILGIVGVFH